MTELDDYDPYCKICGGCGEDGCCSALMCKQHPDGRYCKTYLQELRFSYAVFREVYDLIPEDEETQKKLDEIYDRNYDRFFQQSQEKETSNED